MKNLHNINTVIFDDDTKIAIAYWYTYHTNYPSYIGTFNISPILVYKNATFYYMIRNTLTKHLNMQGWADEGRDFGYLEKFHMGMVDIQ